MKKIPSDILSQVIKKRNSDSFKGTYGKVLLIGGNQNYGGAIIMAAEACVNTGAGLTTVATDSVNLSALHTRVPEAMFVDYTDQKAILALLSKVNVVALGPGLGNEENALNLVKLILQNIAEDQTLILDASALDVLASHPNLLTQLKNLVAKVILTPHQMEWQRLSGITISEQKEEPNCRALQQLGSDITLILKSNHTTIYDSTHQNIWQNHIGNPGMATGGMGDTLTGIIAGMVAQFGNSTQTILAAVYLHSYVGDLVAQDNYVVLPTAISRLIPRIMHDFQK